jgi:hypothetical protein
VRKVTVEKDHLVEEIVPVGDLSGVLAFEFLIKSLGLPEIF